MNKRQCFNKLGTMKAAYPKERLANQAAKQAKIPMRSYQCSICNFWHLTKDMNKDTDVTSELQRHEQRMEESPEYRAGYWYAVRSLKKRSLND